MDVNIDDVWTIPDFLQRARGSAPVSKTTAPRRKKLKVPKLNLVKAPALWEKAQAVLLQPGIDWPKTSGACYARMFLVKPSRSKKYVWVRDASHAFGYHTKEWVKNDQTNQPELQKVIRGVKPVVKLTKKQFDCAVRGAAR